MQAVILAAGKGTRFKQLTQNQPKCMVQINGETLIHRLLRQLDTVGLTKIVLVTGYKADVLHDYVDGLSFNTPISFVFNNEFDTANNIVSVQKAAESLAQEDTLMLESDLILADGIIERLAKSDKANFAVVSPFQSWMDGTCVTQNAQGNVATFVPKAQINRENTQNLLKTVNVYRLSAEYSRSRFLPYLEAQITGFGGDSYYETVFGVLTAMDQSDMAAEVISPDDWYETDDVQDLRIAEIKFCSDPVKKMKAMGARFGGYWRFPSVHDYAYLVNPFFPPKSMVNEFHENLRHLIVDYPSGLSVNSGLAAKYYSLRPEQIVVGNGAAELIKVVLDNSVGKIGVIRPTFEEYPNRVDEKRLVYMETDALGYEYSGVDIQAFFADKGISQLIVINPDNPSGNYLTHAELIGLCEWTTNAGINLIVDESFSDFADAESMTSMLDEKLLDQFANLVVIKSISKSFGVPGVRLGVLASGNQALIADIKKRVSIWNINSFGEFFLQIIEKYKVDYLTALKRFYTVRQELGNGLRQLDYVSTRTLYQPDFKQKRQIIQDTGSRPAGIICRSLYAH